MNLRVFDDRVIIEPIEAPQETSAGVAIPVQAQEKPAEGWVVAVGPGLIKGENIQLHRIYLLIRWAIAGWWTYLIHRNIDEVPSYPDLTAMQVFVGDYVIFGRYAGTRIKWQGKEYMMVRQADVFFADPEKKRE